MPAWAGDDMTKTHPLLERGHKTPWGWLGRTNGATWAVTKEPGATAWSGTSFFPGAKRQAKASGWASPYGAAGALCIGCERLREWLKAHNLNRQIEGRALQGAAEGDAVMLDPRVLQLSEELDEATQMVSDREGVIERGIETLTGKPHTYTDGSGELLLAECHRATEAVAQAQTETRKARALSEVEVSRMDARRHRSTVALRAVVEALSPAGFRLSSDKDLETVALAKVLGAVRRIEQLERQCQVLRSREAVERDSSVPF